MQIDWHKIKKEYPKGTQQWQLYKNNNIINGYCGCFCDIIKFLDSCGIYIFSLINTENLFFGFEIWDGNKDNSFLFSNDCIDRNYKTRDESQEQAVYKAFEILEEQVK